MFGSEGFDRYTEFNRSISVDRNELVMLELNDVSALLRKYSGNLGKHSRLIGKKYGYGKDPVSCDKSVLNNGTHGDDIHVSSGKDRYNLFAFGFHMLESRNSKKP